MSVFTFRQQQTEGLYYEDFPLQQSIGKNGKCPKISNTLFHLFMA